MMTENPLFWKQGLFLHPQHFQLMSRQLHGDLEPVLRLASPRAYGVRNLKIRSSALENGVLDITGGDFLFPDGTYARLPANAVLAPRQMAGLEDTTGGQLVTAYVGLRKWNDRGRNVSPRETRGRGVERVESMYVSDLAPETVPDLYSDGPEAEILTMHYALKIILEPEIAHYGECHLLPVARLRKVGDRFQIENGYIPPALSIGAHPDLFNMVHNIRDCLLGRGKRLGEYKLARDISPSSLLNPQTATMLLALRSLNRYAALFDHICEARDVHPWDVYGVIRQLAGELSSFSAGLDALCRTPQGETLLPPYDHSDPGRCFARAEALVTRLLDELVVGPEAIVPFEQTGAIMSAGLPSDKMTEGYRCWLMIRPQHEINDTAVTLHNAIKLGPESAMKVLRARALPGVALTPCGETPPGLPRREGTSYLEIECRSQLWQETVAEGRAGLIWEGQTDTFEAFLAVMTS